MTDEPTAERRGQRNAKSTTGQREELTTQRKADTDPTTGPTAKQTADTEDNAKPIVERTAESTAESTVLLAAQATSMNATSQRLSGLPTSKHPDRPSRQLGQQPSIVMQNLQVNTYTKYFGISCLNISMSLPFQDCFHCLVCFGESPAVVIVHNIAAVDILLVFCYFKGKN